MQIQLSENIYLQSNSRCFELAEKVKRNDKEEIRPFKYFTSLESLFKEYLSMKIRNSQTAEFAELVLLHVEAIKEIKKVVKQLEVQNVRTKL